MTQTIDSIRQQIKEHVEDTLAKCNVKPYTAMTQSATLPAPCPPTTKKQNSHFLQQHSFSPT